uniref:S5A_REDUCTASE domain-containing protein n=1 Tax=Heterorhabditis bacteriophora TaxID=37862 RepID=A0A1I7XKG9_HETBA
MDTYKAVGMHSMLCMKQDSSAVHLLISVRNVTIIYLYYTGVLVFSSGMFINVQSDSILRNLRKPKEMGYQIPRGGLFEFVSGANFFGEIVEWMGYALICRSLPAIAFALFTICNIGPRAIQHHK